ncbi:MAG: hypothetical protein ACRDJH_16875 [Thermomicrobiales bacterium]
MLTAGACFGATFPLVLGYAGVQARRAGEPRVIALGAGDALSVLITAGQSRLLIATGTDTTAFGNALASALPFGLRRVDVVLLAGQGRNISVAAHAARSVRGRTFAIIDPGLSPDDGDFPSSRPLEVFDGPRQYQLPKGITVTIVTAHDGERSGWRALIARGQSRIVVLPDGRLSDLFPLHEPVSVLIVTGDYPADAIQATQAPAVVVCAESVSEDALREGIDAVSMTGLFALTVFAGQAKAIEFVDGGLRLPGGTRSMTSGEIATKG